MAVISNLPEHRNLSPIKGLVSSPLKVSSSESIPFIDKTMSGEKKTPEASKVEVDLPKYSVQIPSRFSPVKKAPKKFEFPKQVSFSNMAVTTQSTSAVRAATKKFDLPIQQQKSGLTSSVPVNRSVGQLEKKISNSVIDVPVSSIKSRVQNLEKMMTANNDRTASPAPELLPLRMRKGLFERKIREETQAQNEVIKRDQFLCKKKIPVRESTTNFQSGLVRKMQERLWTTGENGEPLIKDVDNNVDETFSENKVSPKKQIKAPVEQEMDVVEEEVEEEPIPSTNQLSKSTLSSRIQIQAPNFGVDEEESALAHLFDIEEPSPDSDKQSGRRFSLNKGVNDATETDMEADGMSICTQSSIESKSASYQTSPCKSTSSSVRMYPDLSEDDDDRSPVKKSKMSDDEEKLNDFTDQEDAGLVSEDEAEEDGAYAKIAKSLPTMSPKPTGTPVRTISAFRLEQRMNQKPFGSERRVATVSIEDKERQREEKERIEKLTTRIAILKKHDVPRYEALITQSSQALSRCLASSDFKDSTAHADAERHLLVSYLQRAAAINQIHDLNTQLSHAPEKEFVLGNLKFTKIDLPITSDTLLAHKKGLAAKTADNQHFFCVISCDGSVISTECQAFSEGYSSGFLTFVLPSAFGFKELKNNFQIRLDIYCVTLQSKKEANKHALPKFSLTPSKKPGKNVTTASPSVGRILEPKAILKGTVIINSNNIKQKEFELQNFRFEATLQGRLRLSISAKPVYQGSYSNFLSFYDDKEDIGVWKRRWCRLDGPKILIWRLPKDEETKPAQQEIDLRHCINPKLCPATFEVCPKKESFAMILAGINSDKTRLRVKYLVDKNYEDTIEKRLVAADVIEERDEWIHVLNRSLEGIRSWDEEALLPCSPYELDKYLNA